MKNRTFIVDAMLGGIARKLRMLGHDTTYKSDMDDDIILKTAEMEGRVLVTMDAELYNRAQKAGIPAVRPIGQSQAEQLLHIADMVCLGELRVDSARSRCAVCNGVLYRCDTSPDTAVLQRACMDCSKRYWHGSHIDNLQREIDAALLGKGDP